MKNYDEHQSSKKSKLEVKKEQIAIERCQCRGNKNAFNSIQNLENDNHLSHNKIVNADQLIKILLFLMLIVTNPY